MLKIKKPRLTKRDLLVGLAVLVAVVGSVFAYRHLTKPTPPTVPADVKLAPATEEEKKESDANKQRLVDEKNNQPSQDQSSEAKQVGVIITNASSESVNAYVTGVFEENGVCTATFTQGSTVVTRSSSGFANVSYTQCEPITPNLPNPTGWSVVVSYSSASAQGKSQAQTF